MLLFRLGMISNCRNEMIAHSSLEIARLVDTNLAKDAGEHGFQLCVFGSHSSPVADIHSFKSREFNLPPKTNSMMLPGALDSVFMKSRVNSTPDSRLSGAGKARLNPIRIVVVDDHPIIREGIVANLTRQRDMKVVGQGGDGREALTIIQQLLPDLVLLDLHMPRMDGLNLLKEINQSQLPTKAIVMTALESEEDIQSALRNGARGYLLKSCSQPMLLEAIRRVQGGEVYLLPHIAQKLVERMQAPQLSQRELEVLTSMTAGKINKEIGVQLGIAEGTVKSHVASLLAKFGVATRTSAIKEGVRRGLVRMA